VCRGNEKSNRHSYPHNRRNFVHLLSVDHSLVLKAYATFYRLTAANYKSVLRYLRTLLVDGNIQEAKRTSTYVETRPFKA
jgi:hypothetical protein